MQVIMNREEFRHLRNIITEIDNSTVTEVFNGIFSDNPPDGISWTRSEDKSKIAVNLSEDLACEFMQVLSQYASGISGGIGSVTAIPKLISTIKRLGDDLKKVFVKS